MKELLQDCEFTKSHTKIAKGVAIILMMTLHLFSFPDRLDGVSYISVLPFYNPTIEFYLGGFGYICIGMYLFLSGYGLYSYYVKKNKFTLRDLTKKMCSILINYWVVFAIFVPIGLIGFSNNPRYEWNLSNFLKNLFVLSDSYNGEWWFLKTYIILLLLFPIIKYMIREKPMFAFAINILLYITYIGSPLLLKLFPQRILGLIYGKISNMILWIIIFCMGCMVAKHDLFKIANKYFKNKKLNKSFFYLLGIFVVIIIRIILSSVFKYIGSGNTACIDFILAPLLILFCTNIINNSKIKQIFLTFGKHSTNIWLTHTFFAYYYFQKIVFYPKLSILILIWLSILTIISSKFINYIISKLNMLIKLSEKKIYLSSS